MGILSTFISELFGKSLPRKQHVREHRRHEIDLPPAKLLVIADLHCTIYEELRKIRKIIEQSSPDCILFLGDIYREDICDIMKAADGIPCYYVLGNHDSRHQNEGIPGLRDLDGRTAVINGIRISGVSGAAKYKEGDFCMRTEEEMSDVLSGIGLTDILVSHEAPYHLLGSSRTHGGFQAISDFLSEKKPQVHLFGHYHYPEETWHEGTKEVCIYHCATVSTRPFTITNFE